MNITPDKVFAFIGREFATKPRNIIKFLSVLFCFNLVVFGYFGVYKGYKAYTSKTALLKSMRNLEVNLAANDAKLTEIGPYVSNSSGTSFIHNSIPDTVDAWNYMVALSTIATDNFIQLQGITFSKNSTSNAIPVTIRMQGSVSNLGEFLEDIEGLVRLSTVKQLSYSPFGSVDGVLSISISLEIYKKV